MSNESPGFFRQLPSALPGLALIVVTLTVIRLWVEPWMGSVVVFGDKGWLIQTFHLNFILLGILCGMLYRNVIFGGTMPEVFSNGFKLSRLMIKTGIVMLGSLYTFSAIVQLGSMAIFLIGGNCSPSRIAPVSTACLICSISCR